ncbi:hypothetical protein PAXINDRAFT_14546 [Paxillus involutus ATCC 200175]|uniref:Uncharacterized protein n=1 Tax=Paxillus involutus ATCC 200175 TaxID=664439 RepID=A0A0C9TZC1_PAXIN|nr:hypothetical protein PAXINDRAFT_14546 [Paxillus involutus ATCC 200175]
MAEIPALRKDGRNWSTWCESLERALDELGVRAYLSGTKPNPYDEQANAIAKCAIASSIPDSLFLRILNFESAHEYFKTLKNLFKMHTFTMELLQEIRNNRMKQDTTYGLEMANDRVCTHSHVGDTSCCDDDISNRSVRRNDHVPNSNTRRQHKRETTSQGRVERGCGEGEEGGKSKGRKDGKATAATGPGRGATDHTADSISLVKPTSRQEDLPGTRVDPPCPHHHPKSPSPSPTPNLLFEQTAPTSKRPTDQRRRDGHVPRNGTHRTREDVEWSRGRVKSRSREGREAVDEDGEDVHVHHANVEPQQPQLTCQTAIVDEAADPSNPHATCAGPTEPAGTSNGPPNGSNKVEGKGGKGEGNERARGIVDPSSNGENAVSDLIPPVPNPDELTPSPSSTPLEGENEGERTSRRPEETATHLETPRPKSRTTPPTRTPYDRKSNGEGRRTAIGHWQAVGEEDEEVGVSDDDMETSYRVDERRSRRGEARDKAEDDEEGQEDEGRPNEGEERRTAAMNANDEDNTPSTPPAPQPPPAPLHQHQTTPNDTTTTT